MTFTTPRRPLARRTTYELGTLQDQFIVPLLNGLILDALRAFATPSADGARVLDIGCGAQPFRATLEQLGFEYHSMDVTQNENGTVELVYAIDQPLPSELTSAEGFDLLLCTEVLEHVADWTTAFGNLHALLAPGGRVLVTCPHFFPLHEEPYDFWRATPYALEHFAIRAGLRTVDQQSAGTAWDVLGTLLGHCYTGPASRRLVDRVLARIVSASRQLLFAALRDRHLQNRVKLQGSIYLANVAVFERPR